MELQLDEHECVADLEVLEDGLLLSRVKHLEDVVELMEEHFDFLVGARNVNVPVFERLNIQPVHVLRGAVESLVGAVDSVIVSVHDESFLS